MWGSKGFAVRLELRDMRMLTFLSCVVLNKLAHYSNLSFAHL